MDLLLRFRPTDEQLFAHYLVGKATGAPLPPGLIEECDVYGQEPWKIFDTTSDRTFYVFTTLRKNKSRVLRTAGSGTWKEQHTSEIRDVRGALVGYRKSFKFKGGSGSSAMSGRWIMYEFSMCEEMQCKYVLCRIKYYKDEKKSEGKAIVISDDTLQFERENRQTKRARLLDGDSHRTNVIDDSAVTLPLTTIDQAQPAASQAFSSGVAHAEPLWMTIDAAFALHIYTGDTAIPGFSGDANASSLPLITAATMQPSNDEWTEGWTTTELDPVVHSGYNPKSRSVAPVGGGYTNLLLRASSPPTATMTMSTTLGPDIDDPMSRAFGSDTTLDSLVMTAEAEAATVRRDICYASYSPTCGCNRDADVLPLIATSAQVDTGGTTCPNSDGDAYVDLLPTAAELVNQDADVLPPIATSAQVDASGTTCPNSDSGAYVDLLPTTAEQLNTGGWMERLTMNMEMDPVVCSDYLYCSNLFDNPLEGDTNATLASALGKIYNQTWDICYASYSPACGCNRDDDVLPLIATSAQVDTGGTTCPNSDGGAYVDLLPTAAEQVNTGGWMERLMMNMEMDPEVCSDYLYCSNLFANPAEGDTNAMLASTLGGPYNQTRDPTSLHQQRSVAESQ